MANYFPLIVDAANNTIDELPAGDNLDLTGSNIVNAIGITATGNITGGNLDIQGNIVTVGIKTSNYYYANGALVSFQNPGGSNNEIQYNVNNVFSASSNFTFNPSTNVLAVVGNISGGNISATSTLSVTGNSNVGNIGATNGVFTGLVSASGNVTGANLITTGITQTGTLNVTGNSNVGNIGVTNAVYVGNILVSSNNITGANLISATSFAGNGSLLQSLTGANVTGTVANATYATSAGTAGTVTTAAQPNITSVGTLSSLTVTGNANVGNVSSGTGTFTGAIVGTTTLSITGNANLGNLGTGAGTFTGSIVGTSGLSITGNANVGNIGATNGVFTNISGNGALITALSGASVTGSVANATYANIAGVAYSVSVGNVSGIGNIATVNLDGNAGNILYGNGAFAAVPNVSNVANANYANFAGTAYSVSGSNVSGSVANATYANIAGVAYSVSGSNVSGAVANATYATSAGTAETVTTAAQPNITSVGTLTSLNISGNIVVGGDLTVNGNLAYVNVTTLAVEDPIIELGGGPNNAPLTTNDGKDRGTLLHYYTTAPVDAFMGWDNSNGEFAFGSNVSLSSEVVTFNTLGNVRANVFIGKFSGNAVSAWGITDGNVTNPGLYFNDDADTGIYSPTNGVTAFTQNGVEQVRIDSNGNVGIGETNPISKLDVNGSFSATSKSFVINHPTKPDHKLRYGSLESPYHGVRLTGDGTIVNGKATVTLPDYISQLVKEDGAQVQVTGYQHCRVLWVEKLDIPNNQFEVKARYYKKDQDKELKFFWSFTAIRKDIEDLVVEFPISK